eukprot:CAMPEP_0174891972 /NCGR_PEP_ID=MMETSP0167-20121228/6986_1 /TAXON_ID=38298 /ORGANISM="Rhodella maculata, Strain CCMP736" /LENGTH=272 /DNA_ID=CAMNT_0016130313 /DNA_START=107 /DNA_END=923 /DNA_ORIENTATION=+
MAISVSAHFWVEMLTPRVGGPKSPLGRPGFHRADNLRGRRARNFCPTFAPKLAGATKVSAFSMYCTSHGSADSESSVRSTTASSPLPPATTVCGRLGLVLSSNVRSTTAPPLQLAACSVRMHSPASALRLALPSVIGNTLSVALPSRMQTLAAAPSLAAAPPLAAEPPITTTPSLASELSHTASKPLLATPTPPPAESFSVIFVLVDGSPSLQETRSCSGMRSRALLSHPAEMNDAHAPVANNPLQQPRPPILSASQLQAKHFPRRSPHSRS